ncbi:MAG TPA: isoprenylcysteine carboxylmethyltransferase family protein [Terracidiphilus sp.]|nr:isoprenylcysteine carboxylmethyltransferase family protein [Terracidiphilus sp.]
MSSLRRNIAISALFTLFGGPALVLGYIPWTITRYRIPAAQSPAQILLAALIILAGLIPLLESILRFIFVGRGTLVPLAPPRHLVVSGLYRRVRNPMYVGVLTSISGEALLFRNRDMLIYLAIVALAMHLFVCLYEEPKLARSFPVEYARYKLHVSRWIPRFTPWKPSA